MWDLDTIAQWQEALGSLGAIFMGKFCQLNMPTKLLISPGRALRINDEGQCSSKEQRDPH